MLSNFILPARLVLRKISLRQVSSGLVTLLLLPLPISSAYAETYVYEVTPSTAIPDNACPTYTQIPISVSGTFTVAGLNVGLNITHLFRDELDVFLRSPAGTLVELFTDVGGTTNNDFDIMLERGAGFKTNATTNTRNITANTGINDTNAPYYDAVYTPELQPGTDVLNAFDGEAANGIWNLEVCDDTGGDTGTVNRALLSFTQGINPLPVSDTNGAGKVCNASGMDGLVSTSGVVNTYYPGTAAPVSGDINLILGTPVGSATGIGVGDLVMVIQMQDAVFDTSNSVDYGDGQAEYTSDASGSTGIGSTGLYEFATVSAFNSGTGALTLNAGLAHNYFSGTDGAGFKQSYQVIRVPRYGDLTLTGDIRPRRWTGNTGGVLVLDVLGTLDFNGSNIVASGNSLGRGFRPGIYVGGTSNNRSNVDPAYAAVHVPGNLNNELWAEKGEGIAGTPSVTWTSTAYPAGDLARGAPGNAGGGGNDHNGGGGGGSNIGWGGQGGDAWSVGIDAGGRGGGSFEGYIGRLLLGGGGGAANANNNVVAGAGGSGGGLVFINATTITGTGTIDASGGRAVDSNVGYPQGNDGAGGGGGGGTVVIRTASTSIPNLTIDVSGGDGGDVITGSAHGPGGGGGGGALYIDAMINSNNINPGKAGRFCATSIAASCTPASDNVHHGAQPGGPGQQLSLDETNLPAPIGCDYPDEENYGSTTTVHEVDAAGGATTGLTIGATVDFEAAGLGTNAADTTGDNANDSSGTAAGDDEDGVSFSLVQGNSSNMTATVTYNNPSAGNANLCGWADVNGNGSYESSEGACVVVGAGASTVDLLFTGLQTNAAFQLYSRFRITTDPLTTSDPSISVTDGEAEAYLIDVDPTVVTIGRVELNASRVIDFLSGLNVEQMDIAALSALLTAWDANAAASAGSDRTALLQALSSYLDPNADGQLAVFSWDTLEERGTIGFYVERREEGGGWKRINNDILPGLITAPMGGEYQLADPSAVTEIPYEYRLIEQEARGSTRTYGPFRLELIH